MDIHILVESVTNYEHMAVLKKIQEEHNNKNKAKKIDLKAAAQPPPKPLTFDEIKESLNGFARIVYYKSTTTDPSPLYNQIESMTEGEIKNGLMNGYCRSISAIDGSCAVGFHKDGIPNGKWTCYKANGEFSLPQGLYEGSSCI